MHGTAGQKAPICAEFSVGRKAKKPIIRPDRLVQHSHAKRRQADEPQTSHRAKKVVFCYEPTTANPPPLKYRATTPQYSPIHANTDQVVDHRPGIQAFEHSILASWRRRVGVGFCVSNASSPPAPIRPCRGGSEMSPVALHSPGAALQPQDVDFFVKTSSGATWRARATAEGESFLATCGESSHSADLGPPYSILEEGKKMFNLFMHVSNLRFEPIPLS
ncbi:conserved hypothetical protein [Histoplasma capsulatum var. duboisii H88]|uniref:Uncharacterized protein n=1 Tax=Ajellomyces capsulatus (strain H88) TaxID=544711 RepID=F0UCJ2_AJEC8|nr:conserved hypothetical protein [Histoplasma capsulatum var. duboisii H88]